MPYRPLVDALVPSAGCSDDDGAVSTRGGAVELDRFVDDVGLAAEMVAVGPSRARRSSAST